MNTNKPYCKVILWGSDATHKYSDTTLDFVDLKPLLGEQITIVGFDTEAELNAYLKGLDDMAGWRDYYVL